MRYDHVRETLDRWLATRACPVAKSIWTGRYWEVALGTYLLIKTEEDDADSTGPLIFCRGNEMSDATTNNSKRFHGWVFSQERDDFYEANALPDDDPLAADDGWDWSDTFCE